MTDEAKALGRAAAAIWAWVPIGEGRVEHVNACGKAADLIETQAREIERLRDGLSEVRQLIGQPLESALATIAGIDLAAAKALAGDSHDQ